MEKNEDFLKGKLFFPFVDLAVAICFVVENNASAVGMMHVPEWMADKWEVTKEQVLKEYADNRAEAVKRWGKEPFELKNVVKYWIRGNEPDLRVIPTDTLYITIDKAAVKKSGMMMPSDELPDKMVIDLTGMRYITKGQLMTLEIVAGSNWTRPVYIATTVGEENFLRSFRDHFVQEGLANRITPFLSDMGIPNFDSEKTYNAVMNRFRYGNVKKKGIYLAETVLRLCYTHRSLFAKLALTLIEQDQINKARKVLAKMEEELPTSNVPIDIYGSTMEIITAYGALNNKKMMHHWAESLWKKSEQYFNWYTQLSPKRFQNSISDCQRQLYIMGNIYQIVSEFDSKWADELEKKLKQLQKRYEQKGGQPFYTY